MTAKKKEQDKFLWTAKVSEKGQIVIPKQAREEFNIKEGDTLLLLGDKSKGIATSKILFNLLLNLPCLLVGEIGFCLLFKLGFVLSLTIIVFSLIYLFMCSGLGLLINLRFPKLNWTSEVQVSKQGLSLLITMFVDMAICLFPMILYFALLDQIATFSLALYICLFTIPVAVAAVVIYILLATIGNTLYQKIS